MQKMLAPLILLLLAAACCAPGSNRNSASRRMASPVGLLAPGSRRSDFRSGICRGRLAEDHRSQHCAGRAGRCGKISRSLLRDEPAPDSRHKLSRRPYLRQPAHARGQPISMRLVVSQRVLRAGGIAKDGRFWLHFGGINYRGEVWLNGHKIADSTDVAGAYRTYDFDVTEFLKPGKTNVLAVEDFCAHGKGSGHQLGRLESLPARQGHGPVGRGRSGRDRRGHRALADGCHALPRSPRSTPPT